MCLAGKEKRAVRNNLAIKAAPAADTRDVDDKRGVLEWRFDLEAGTTKVITLEQYLEWPEGQVLR